MEVYDSAMEDQTRMRLTRALLDNQTLEQAALDSQARCEQLERAAQDDAATIDELRAKLAHVQHDAADLTDKNRALAEDAKKLSHELVASEQLAIAAVDKNGEAPALTSLPPSLRNSLNLASPSLASLPRLRLLSSPPSLPPLLSPQTPTGTALRAQPSSPPPG